MMHITRVGMNEVWIKRMMNAWDLSPTCNFHLFLFLNGLSFKCSENLTSLSSHDLAGSVLTADSINRFSGCNIFKVKLLLNYNPYKDKCTYQMNISWWIFTKWTHLYNNTSEDPSSPLPTTSWALKVMPSWLLTPLHKHNFYCFCNNLILIFNIEILWAYIFVMNVVYFNFSLGIICLSVI